jgi:transcriptional regulator with GAF, ATPase, and Fis domain/tetratricopeptide (TPR) repeat protein
VGDAPVYSVGTTERRPEAPADRSAQNARGAQLERLQALWDRYRSSQRRGTVVVVHGPQPQSTAGLVKEWRRGLVQQGEQVFEATCTPGGGTYAPLRQLVSAYYGYLDELGMLTAAIEALFTELSGSLGMPSLGVRPPEGSSTPGQIYFYELLGRYLVEVTNARPAILVVRDLHLADSSSVAAIMYLAENFALDPVDAFIPEGISREGFRGLLCLTLRTEGEGRRGLLSGLVRGLRDRPGAEFVDLRALDEEIVRRFLQQPEVVDRVLAATAGSAGNLAALLELLPGSAADLLRRRLDALPDDARELAEALAVHGGSAPVDALARLVSTADVPRLLAELLEDGLLTRTIRQGGLQVSFADRNAGPAVYQLIRPARRAALHGRLAGLLLERQKLGGRVELELIAEHFLRSDEKEQACHYALAAAEQLFMSYAYERARQLLEIAVPLLTDPEELIRVHERLIDISKALGDHKRALFFCGHLKKRVTGASLGACYRRIGGILLAMGKYDLAERALARALHAAGTSDNGAELLHVLSLTAEALYGRGEYERCVEVCKKGLERARVAQPRNPPESSSGSPAAVGRRVVEMRNTLGKVCLFKEDYAEAQRHFGTNAVEAERRGWPDEHFRALFNLGTIAVTQRKFGDGEQIFHECLGLGYQTVSATARAVALMNLGVIYQRTYRYDEAVDHYLRALAGFKKSGNDLQFAVTATNLADIYVVVGDFAKARALVDASIRITEAGEMRYFHARSCNVRGRIALKEREYTQALEDFERAREGLKHGGPTYLARVRLHTASAHHALGQNDERDHWLAMVEPSEDSAAGRELAGDRALLVAEILADKDDWEGAEASAQEARRCFEEDGLTLKQWLTLFLLGRVCYSLDREREARLHVRRAQQIVASMTERVPEPLRERFESTDEVRSLTRLARALERGHPFALEEVPEPVQTEPEVVEAGVVRIGEPVSPTFRRWRTRYEEIIGEAPRLHHLFRIIDKVATSDSTMLLIGESGTGKELLTEAIHRHSNRVDGPLVKVNCAAFVETLLLSELFGHEKGAFTGALTRKKGRFELAHGGTIFLDEIGDISPNTQVSLLRVLQERSFERVGGSGSIAVDVRVVAATNRNLEEMVRQGKFRLDLYYRLKGVVLELPPLRLRPGDIPLLVRFFTESFVTEGPARYFSHAALQLLASYNWPGNIRELENFVRSMLLFVDDPVITDDHIREFDQFFAAGEMAAEPPVLGFVANWWTPEETEAPDEVAAEAGTAPAEGEGDDQNLDAAAEVSGVEGVGNAAVMDNPEAALVRQVVAEGLSIQALKKRLEIECIKRALIETDGNITHAANILQMKRPRLSQIINANDELTILKEKYS